VLIHAVVRGVGDPLTWLFVDNGLLRKGEVRCSSIPRWPTRLRARRCLRLADAIVRGVGKRPRRLRAPRRWADGAGRGTESEIAGS
jgi:hypothetical protein